MRGFWGVMIDDAVVSDAKLNPGYSGGPLVDASGNLLGMNVAYFSGRGVAISVDSLKETIGKISKDGRVKKGFLGVVVEPVELPEELAKAPDVGAVTDMKLRFSRPAAVCSYCLSETRIGARYQRGNVKKAGLGGVDAP